MSTRVRQRMAFTRSKPSNRRSLDDALHEVSLAITSTLDFETIMKRAVRIARRAMGVEGAVVLLREGERYVVRYADGVPRHTVGTGFMDADAQAFADATKNREKVVISDTRHDPRLARRLILRYVIRSLLSEPIFLYGEPAGVLVFSNHSRPLVFSEEQLDFSSRLSAMLSLAIQNSRLFAHEQEAKLLADTLNEINSALSSTTDPELVMSRVLELSATRFGAEQAVVTTREGDLWVIRHAYGLPAGVVGSSFPSDLAEASMLCAATRQTVVSEDAYRDRRFHPGIMRSFGIRAFIISPLIVKGDVIGVVSLQYKKGPVLFTDSQVDFAGRLALSVSLAYEKYRLTKSLERELKQTEFLKEVATAITGTLNIREVCRKTLEIAQRYLDARTGSVYYVNEAEKVVEHLALFGYPDEISRPMESLSLDWDTNVVRIVRGVPILTHESTEQAEVSVRRYKSAGLDNHRWFILPVIVKGKTIGVFGLSFEGVRSFTGEELSLYRSVAEQLGVALENARLYQEEQRIAEVLQEPLVVLPSRTAGLEIGHLYRSATTGAKVGGDFYDLIPLGNEEVIIVIGDVAGKGLEAANLTAMIKSTIRAYGREGHSPAEIVSRTNHALLSIGERLPYVTLFLGLLGRRPCRLSYVGAGHPPPILRHADSSTEFLGGRDLPIGISERTDYVERLVMLSRGDLLLFYTDGIIEARREGELYGEERLAKAMAELDLNPHELVEALLRDATNFSSGELRDDVAVLAVALT